MTSRRASAATAILLLLLSARLAGQELPDLRSLRVSAPPAFALLGVSPASVDRPSSPRQLGLDLADRTGFFQSLPRDFALETSPYWLVGHPRLTWRMDTVRTIPQSLARTFSVSAASAELGDSARPLTGVALGIRVLPLSGRYSRKAIERFAALEASLGRENEIFFRSYARERALQDSSLHATLQALRASISDAATLAAAQQAVTGAYQAAKEQLEARILADSAYRAALAAERAQSGFELPQREGAMLELSAATVWSFPNAVWDRGRYQRAAAWLALSYEGPKVTPVLLLRYMTQGSDTLPNVLDAGGRLIYDGPNWGVSLEGVMRNPTSGTFSTMYRVAGMLEYEVVPQLWVIGTFGRDYQTQRSGSILAQLGIKLNVSRDRGAPPE